MRCLMNLDCAVRQRGVAALHEQQYIGISFFPHLGIMIIFEK